MFLTKHKNGVYYLYFKDDISGKRKSISTKARFKPEALKFLSNFKTFLTERTQAELIKHNKPVLLSELQSEVLNYVKNNMEHSTFQIYRRVFNDMIRIIGNKPIKLISVKDLELYKETRLKEVKQWTCNIDLRTIKAIFNIAIKYGYLTTNAMRSVKLLHIPEREYLAFSETQLNLILNNIPNETMKNIVLLALYTGCRLNEVVNIQWSDVDFNQDILTIRNKQNFKTKTGKIRQIPLSEALRGLLRELYEQKHKNNIFNLTDYIFTNNKGYKLNKDYVSKEFKKVLRALNFEDKYHFHCLRHSFITNLIKKNIPLSIVQKLAGHSNSKTTENYIHIQTEDLREAVNKINITS